MDPLIHLETRTPIWTGGVKSGTMENIQLPSLIGSLRWWYEALIRGFGGWACDPSSEDRCPQGDDSLPREQRYCAACQLFGATGWARAFKAIILNDQTHLSSPHNWPDRVSNGTDCMSKYRFNMGSAGLFDVKFFPRLDDPEIPELLTGLLKLIAANAALGAKTGLGYGVFTLVSVHPENFKTPTADRFIDLVSARASSGRTGLPQGNPDLKEMFFARFMIDNASWSQSDFLRLKCDLRQEFRNTNILVNSGNLASLRHFFLGTTRGELEGSKIKLAMLPGARGKLNTLRVWGWVPDYAPYTQDELKDKLMNFFASYSLLKSASGSKVYFWDECSTTVTTRSRGSIKGNVCANPADLIRHIYE